MFSRERSDLLLCFHKISALWINRKFEPHQRCCPEPADTELPQAQEGNFSCFFPTRRAPLRQFALCSWCLCSHRGVRPCLHIQWGDLRRPSPGLGKSLCPAAAQPYWGKECRELPAIPLPRSQGNAGKEKGAARGRDSGNPSACWSRGGRYGGFYSCWSSGGLQDAFPAVGVMHHSWQGEGVGSPGRGHPAVEREREI